MGLYRLGSNSLSKPGSGLIKRVTEASYLPLWPGLTFLICKMEHSNSADYLEFKQYAANGIENGLTVHGCCVVLTIGELQ